MTQEQKIAVIGAGAVGGLVASRLARSGLDVSILEKGPQLEALRKNGLVVVEEDQRFQVQVRAASDASELGVQDLIFICLKGQVLTTVAQTLKPLVGKQTHIVSVMNGAPWWFLEGSPAWRGSSRLTAVDPTGSVQDALPARQTTGCVVHLSSSLSAPGVVKKGPGNDLVIGPALVGANGAARELATLLVQAGFNCTATEDIRAELWMKLWGNMTMNPISALTRSTADVILSDPLTEHIVVQVMEEAKAIGARFGISLAMTTAERNAITRQFGAFKTSMLQDLEGGRELEVDALLGAPLELATKAGVPAPWLGALYGLSRQLNTNLSRSRRDAAASHQAK